MSQDPAVVYALKVLHQRIGDLRAGIDLLDADDDLDGIDGIELARDTLRSVRDAVYDLEERNRHEDLAQLSRPPAHTDADIMLADPYGPQALNLPAGAVVDHVIIAAQWRDPHADNLARLAFNWDTDLPPWTAAGILAHVADAVTANVARLIEVDDDGDDPGLEADA